MSERVNYNAIAREINSMADADREMRAKWNKDTESEYADAVLAMDQTHTKRMKEIVMQHGWPTISKVGKQTARDAWLLVQHADRTLLFQNTCLRLMKAAHNENPSDVDLRSIAYLEDRIRVNEGRPQLFGTQFAEVEGKFVPKPIENEEKVEVRREAMGLNTLAEGIAEMQQKYST